jgi:hypothetical protein
MVVGVPGGFTGGVLQLENSPFRKLNFLSLLPDSLASAEHARQPKMCSISGQRIEFLGSAISSALELGARGSPKMIFTVLTIGIAISSRLLSTVRCGNMRQRFSGSPTTMNGAQNLG